MLNVGDLDGARVGKGETREGRGDGTREGNVDGGEVGLVVGLLVRAR
jgi:hypothetical protein